MNKKVAQKMRKVLKKGDRELIALSHNDAEKIKQLSESLGTTPSGVISLATSIIEHAMSREVIIRSEHSNVQLKINAFKNLKPRVRLAGEK
jgi:hypothetical protein